MSEQVVGTWRIYIQRAGADTPPFVEVATLTSDGNMVNVAPTGLASVGRWQQTGDSQFATTFVGLLLRDEQPHSYKVRAQITLSESGDEFEGPFQYELLDADEVVVVSTSGTVHGTRIEVEPLA